MRTPDIWRSLASVALLALSCTGPEPSSEKLLEHGRRYEVGSNIGVNFLSKNYLALLYPKNLLSLAELCGVGNNNPVEIILTDNPAIPRQQRQIVLELTGSSEAVNFRLAVLVCIAVDPDNPAKAYDVANQFKQPVLDFFPASKS